MIGKVALPVDDCVNELIIVGHTIGVYHGLAYSSGDFADVGYQDPEATSARQIKALAFD